MPFRIRPFVRAGRPCGLEVDIRLRLPDGVERRERVKSQFEDETNPLEAARTKAWAKLRELEMMREWKRGIAARSSSMTLRQFEPHFIVEYLKANRVSGAYLEDVQRTLRLHLLPAIGDVPMAEIAKPHHQAIKARLAGHSPKTVKNTLGILSCMLSTAADWGSPYLSVRPAKIEMPKVPKPTIEFLDFDELEALLAASKEVHPMAEAVVLLGAKAGLRRGEMVALEWPDIDFEREFLHIRRSEWRGQVKLPKSGQSRFVGMVPELVAALKGLRHLRGKRVLTGARGNVRVGKDAIQYWLFCSAIGAGLTQKMHAQKGKARVHILRHTFVSHLAMRGVPIDQIRNLAGHTDLATTQRYMHLTPQALREGINTLAQRRYSEQMFQYPTPKALQNQKKPGRHGGDVNQ